MTLTNDMEGTFGDQPIGESVSNSSFRVNRMSNDAGYDYATGIGCARDQDCDPSRVCLADKTRGIP